MPKMMTTTNIAAALGIHKSTVSRQVRAWDMVGPDGLIDFDAYRARRENDVDPGFQTSAVQPRRAEANEVGLAGARSRKLAAEASRAELDLRVRRGELVERSIIAATLEPWIRDLRDGILGVPRDTILDPVQAADCEARLSAELERFSGRLRGASETSQST